jgi:hypothetical protein
MRVTISVTRAATLIRQSRIVSNWESRQKERAGCQAAQAQHEPVGGCVWINRRNWLAVALRQEVRSDARCSLCALIRSPACPRAQ